MVDSRHAHKRRHCHKRLVTGFTVQRLRGRVVYDSDGHKHGGIGATIHGNMRAICIAVLVQQMHNTVPTSLPRRPCPILRYVRARDSGFCVLTHLAFNLAHII